MHRGHREIVLSVTSVKFSVPSVLKIKDACGALVHYFHNEIIIS